MHLAPKMFKAFKCLLYMNIQFIETSVCLRVHADDLCRETWPSIQVAVLRVRVRAMVRVMTLASEPSDDAVYFAKCCVALLPLGEIWF